MGTTKEKFMATVGHAHIKRGMHMCNHSNKNRILNFKVEGKKRVGRPKTRWIDVIQRDLISGGVSEELSQERLEWRKSIQRANPILMGLRLKEEGELWQHPETPIKIRVPFC